MNDMSELERRISAALDRISTHVTTLQRPAPAPEEEAQAPDEDLPAAAELMADLEAERAVTAQLEERVRAIKERQDTRVAELESSLAAAKDRVAALEEENAALRDGDGGTAETPETAAEGEALRRELADLRAEREAERSELVALLAELQPIVEESASA
ncbi:hypothetical protein [Oceaniglobus trochenteri]|uniref:hypothetical protein n=1 Tax=Oceaniglobus trochenteri TaxID=2763260 RepID=UPI001CFFDE0C|nr:hypothetical protein [Oceaniglobus trochenteri]